MPPQTKENNKTALPVWTVLYVQRHAKNGGKIEKTLSLRQRFCATTHRKPNEEEQNEAEFAKQTPWRSLDLYEDLAMLNCKLAVQALGQLVSLN